jgi:hypothetical protein
MATAESIEGAAGPFWFHYDLSNDVLYLRLATAREVEAYGDEDASGFIVLRGIADDRPIGMTIVNWWKRFGSGPLPDSVRELAARVDPWAQRAQAAA